MDDLVIMGAGANPHHDDIITAICARLATLGIEVNRSINGTEAPAFTTNAHPTAATAADTETTEPDWSEDRPSSWRLPPRTLREIEDFTFSTVNTHTETPEPDW